MFAGVICRILACVLLLFGWVMVFVCLPWGCLGYLLFWFDCDLVDLLGFLLFVCLVLCDCFGLLCCLLVG